MAKFTFTRHVYRRRGPEDNRMTWVRLTTDVEYPDDCELLFDRGQRTVMIRKPDGQIISAITGVITYSTPEVTIGQPTEQEGREEY